MKTYLIFVFSILLVPICSGAPATFAEFKQMSQEQQEEFVADDSSSLHEEAVNWWWRLRIGEDAWQRLQRRRLVKLHHYEDFEHFFRCYCSRRRQFLVQEYHRSQANPTPDEPHASKPADGSEMVNIENQFNGIMQMIETLPVTQQNRELAEKAKEITKRWYEMYPSGERWDISKEGMAAIQTDWREIKEAIELLPKATETEVQAEVDKLPLNDDLMRIRGVWLPHKK